MTELSFLIELLLNHELPKETKKLIADRIKEVERNLTPIANMPGNVQMFSGTPKLPPMPVQNMQAPSTLALMAKHGDIPASAVPPETPVPQPVVLSDQEMQARANSLEILKKKKHPGLKV